MNQSSNDQQLNESSNAEIINSVHDIIERFQQYSKKPLSNQNNNNNNSNSEVSSPNVNSMILNLNTVQKAQQTNFAAIAYRPPNNSIITNNVCNDFEILKFISFCPPISFRMLILKDLQNLIILN